MEMGSHKETEQSGDRNPKIPGLKRKIVQGVWALLSNAHFSGFVSGKIYQGPLKRFCVPGLNCYSCPGALGACPLGSLQSFLDARKPRFAFYVIGFLMAVGMLVGRFICGWLCIFGLIQELLYLIPTPKLKIPQKLDQVLRYLKYMILLVFVILLPIILHDEMGVSFPYFCKLICPVGTLQGGIPLLLLNETLRPMAHFLYVWKLGILGLCILAAIFIHRPFCKYICPLGAVYALFSKVSLLQLKLDEDKCVSCGMCAKACGMGVDPTQKACSGECIRCGACAEKCPTGALSLRFGLAGARGKKEQC